MNVRRACHEMKSKKNNYPTSVLAEFFRKITFGVLVEEKCTRRFFWKKIRIALTFYLGIFDEIWAHFYKDNCFKLDGLPYKKCQYVNIRHWNVVILVTRSWSYHTLEYIGVVFHWGHLPLRLSSIEVILRWGCFN